MGLSAADCVKIFVHYCILGVSPPIPGGASAPQTVVPTLPPNPGYVTGHRFPYSLRSKFPYCVLSSNLVQNGGDKPKWETRSLCSLLASPLHRLTSRIRRRAGNDVCLTATLRFGFVYERLSVAQSVCRLGTGSDGLLTKKT